MKPKLQNEEEFKKLFKCLLGDFPIVEQKKIVYARIKHISEYPSNILYVKDAPDYLRKTAIDSNPKLAIHIPNLGLQNEVYAFHKHPIVLAYKEVPYGNRIHFELTRPDGSYELRSMPFWQFKQYDALPEKDPNVKIMHDYELYKQLLEDDGKNYLYISEKKLANTYVDLAIPTYPRIIFELKQDPTPTQLERALAIDPNLAYKIPARWISKYKNEYPFCDSNSRDTDSSMSLSSSIPSPLVDDVFISQPVIPDSKQLSHD